MNRIIFIILFGILIFTNFAVAEESDAPGCCIENIFGATCQKINLNSQFDRAICPLLQTSPLSCDQTPQCTTGCCVNNELGTCDPDIRANECQNPLYFDESDTSCSSIPSCEKGCCVLGGNNKFTTEKECELFSNSAGLNKDWRVGGTEQECLLSDENDEEGACVSENLGEINCRRTKESECKEINFQRGKLCTHEDIGTDYASMSSTGCYNDKVYWYDSAGNRENIYEGKLPGQKTSSWNNGQIKRESESCESGDYACGNCNGMYSVCGKYNSEKDKWKTDNGLTCTSLDCVGTKDAPVIANGLNPDNPEERKYFREDKSDYGYAYNGESWCIFDGYAGYGKDPVGSEHWLMGCQSGKIYKEYGAERSWICIEKIKQDGNIPDYHEANLYDNTNSYENCKLYNQERASDPENWVKHCEENNFCAVISGVCVPKIPLGINDISRSSIISPEIPGQSTTPLEGESAQEDECTLNLNDLVSISELDISQERDNLADYFEFWITRNNVCRTLGDCGTYINYVGNGGNSNGIGSGRATTSSQGIIFGNRDEWKVYLGKSGYFPFINREASYFSNERDSLELTKEEYYEKFDDYNYLNFLKPIENQRIQIITTDETGNPEGEIDADYLAETASDFTKGENWPPNLNLGFHCEKWLAPNLENLYPNSWKDKKAECEKCNNDLLGRPCTEYKCESLGDKCRFFLGNEKTREENSDDKPNLDEGMGKYTSAPYCDYVDCNSDNTEVPKIETQKSGIIKPTGYLFEEYETEFEISSPFEQVGECIDEWEDIDLSIYTSVPSQCKIYFKDEPYVKYDQLQEAWYTSEDGESLLLNHTYKIPKLNLAQIDAIGAGSLRSGSAVASNRIFDLTLYVRCQGYCSNSYNLEGYKINFCLKEKPDMQAPIITEPSSDEKFYLKFGENKYEDFKIFIDEPAICRYSKAPDVNYDQMPSENQFECEGESFDPQSPREPVQSTRGWECKKTIKNLNEAENKIYVKCRDQPWENDETKRNTNQEDVAYTIYASQTELKIDSITPSGEFQTNGLVYTADLQITTSGGFDGSGTSICSWFNNFHSGWEELSETNSNVHSIRNFNFDIGDNTIPIKCVDEAKNFASGSTQVKVKKDLSPPEVLRVYKDPDNGQLIIITDEDAICYYNNFPYCNPFDKNNATAMESIFVTTHTTFFDPSQTYYIKCEDIFGKINSDCAIVIKPERR